MPEDNSNKIHLGDGAYAIFEKERNGVWLCANHHNNRLVWLEDYAIELLVKFVKIQREKHYGEKK